MEKRNIINAEFFCKQIREKKREMALTVTNALLEIVSIKWSKLVVPTVTKTVFSSAILVSEVSVVLSSGCTLQPRFCE